MINYEKEKIFLNLIKEGMLSVTIDGTVINNKTGNILAKKPSISGYHMIGIKYNGKTLHQLVHRLVFLVHGGRLSEEFPIINHIDGNKSNNNFYNLEPSNYSHNLQHARKLELYKLTEEGRLSRIEKISGENHKNCKLSDSQVKEIREKYSSGLYTYRKLAEIFNVRHQTIEKIINHKRRTLINKKNSRD